MSKQSPLEAFDTELFINEIEQLPAILDSRSPSYMKKEEKAHAWETLRTKIY